MAKNAKQKEGLEILSGPLGASFSFTFPIPESHMRRNGHRRSWAPSEKTSKPDLSKLVRAVEDSLTDAEIWEDDSQLIRIETTKQYELTPAERVTPSQGPQAGVVVEVWQL
jgi:Holliday junction resolvase RusA-like endonuclease